MIPARSIAIAPKVVVVARLSRSGAPSEQVMLVKGAVLLAAVAFDVWTKRRAGASR